MRCVFYLRKEKENMDLKTFFDTTLAPEIFSSLCVVLILCIFAIIIAIKARHADPLKKPKGILFIAETLVNLFDGLVDDLMGPQFKGFGGFIMAIACYLFVSFIWGLTGLPSPTAYLAVPLSLGLVTFTMIHATSVKYSKWGYFKRYIDPFPVFLPINLISMWAPLLSLTMRLFGNALAGMTLMSIIYYGIENLSGLIFSFIDGWVKYVILPPFLTPILHCYFDLFSGLIQTTVFIFLSMIFISNEAPEMEDTVKFQRKEEAII